VDIPPLGSLHLESHDGPIHLKVNLGSLDQERTAALIDDPTAISAAGQSAVDDVTKGVLQLALRALGAAIVCALILSALIFRNIRRVAAAGVLALVVTGGSLGLAAGTIRPDAISEPRYEGLLVNAPAVVGDARRIAQDYGKYAEQLKAIVANVSRIYTTVNKLPIYEQANGGIRILHVSDLHLNPSAWPLIKAVSDQFDVRAIVDTGDIADHGSAPESVYVSGIGTLGVPYVYVRGNHDSAETEAAVRAQPNAVVLNGTPVEVAGLRFLGLPDPRFTPDQTTREEDSNGLVLQQTEQLGVLARVAQPAVDVLVLHDPTQAELLEGTAPLVLAGHAHKRSQWLQGEKTRIMVQGSTGGAGLRALENEEPTPVMLTVLYFDASTRQLTAWDDITLGGLGLTSAQIDRHIAARETANGVEPGTETPGPGAGLPTGPNGR
jgi:predicted phosphodiesterase